jgi:hypothetical protein
MHPYISRAVAAERIRDLQNEASAARLARLARQARRRRPAPPAAPQVAAAGRAPQPAADPQLTCAEFLARTGGSLVREPSAAERSHGQPVG